MDEIDRLQLLAQLAEEHCELNHGPQTRPEDYPASDYLVIPIGYKKNDIEEVSVRDLVIPVCIECAQALLEDEWTLLYCIDCGNSRWVCREMARNHYRHHILWLKGCPDCSYEFGGLYFNETPKVAGHPEFIANYQHLLSCMC